MVGINQQIETNSGANDGVGFAVPISAIKRSVAQLREKGTPNTPTSASPASRSTRSWRRSSASTPNSARSIASVVPGGPAAKAGLRGGDGTIRFQAAEYETGGDVIVEVEGRKVVQPDALVRLVDEKKPGEKIHLTILRDDKRKQVEVTLGKRPENKAEPE